MKRLTIYKRNENIAISYGENFYHTPYKRITNQPRKGRIGVVFETRSRKELKEHISYLGTTDADKWEKEILETILIGGIYEKNL